MPDSPFPPTLDTPEFHDMWAQWVQHRKEIKHTLKPTMVTMQLKKLEKMGLDRAIDALENSISQGYQGIFEPKGRNNESTYRKSEDDRGEYRKRLDDLSSNF